MINVHLKFAFDILKTIQMKAFNDTMLQYICEFVSISFHNLVCLCLNTINRMNIRVYHFINYNAIQL